MTLNSFIARAARAFALAACGDAQEPAPAASMQHESKPPVEATAPSVSAPAVPSVAVLRCGDYLTEADLKTLAIEAPSYDEEVAQTDPKLGVICVAGPITAGIFRGDVHETMLRGLEAAGDKSGVKLTEGPSIGAASQWTAMGRMRGLMFTVTSKSHTANISGEDKALIEKVARFLDAKLQ